MQQNNQPNKVLFMGLGASGKSSIRSIVFEGKSLEDVKDYKATINYTRSTKNIIDSGPQGNDRCRSCGSLRGND